MTKKKKFILYILFIGILFYTAERIQVSAVEHTGDSGPSISITDNGKGSAYLLTLHDLTDTDGIEKIQFAVYCRDLSNSKTCDARLDSAGNYVAVLYAKDFASAGNYQVTAYAQLGNGQSRQLAEASFQAEQYQVPDKENGTGVSVLGDSLSTFEGSTAYDSSCSYYNSSIMDVKDTWWMQFILQNGFKLDVNDSIGGSRVTWDGAAEDDAYHLGEHYAISSEERIRKLGTNGTPDVILVFGGMNDLLSGGTVNLGSYSKELIPGKVDDFADAYYTMLFRLKYYYPDAKIICMIPYDTIYAGEGMTDACANIISNLCTEFGAVCVDLRKASIQAEEDLRPEDYIHLNTQGMDKVACELQKTLG